MPGARTVYCAIISYELYWLYGKAMSRYDYEGRLGLFTPSWLFMLKKLTEVILTIYSS